MYSNNILELRTKIRDFRWTHADILTEDAIKSITDEVAKQFEIMAKTPLLANDEIKETIVENIKYNAGFIVRDILQEDEVQEKMKKSFRKMILDSLGEV